MKFGLPPEMKEALRLTRGGRLAEATTVLQRLIGRDDARHGQVETPEVDDPRANNPGSMAGRGSASFPPQPPGGGADWRHVLPKGLFEPGKSAPSVHDHANLVPPGGRFLKETYRDHNGTREYRLYIPSSYTGQPIPLVVMLHGCTQNAEDFAIGTRMNRIAEEQSVLVAYPVQSPAANSSKCWNWFKASEQRRGSGEPALIAGMVQRIMRDYAVDSDRIYAAGLSAGGAAAAVLGATYPDLFAAICVHSGLPCGAASDVTSAFAVMRNGSADGRAQRPLTLEADSRVPTIVFHGDRDKTVHPRNGAQIIAQSRLTGSKLRIGTQRGRVDGGHAYTRSTHQDDQGRILLEEWVVHGGSHAWFGGDAAGSYTDARGPDASREMMRFFLEHRRPASRA
ncbi:extracellular catalytic domain type 1 short-chain-length polyhydroxyalkanoate depolymerase [Microvirga massiliensis]|uniref:extracellular catalytic domain type 1 short-chain-length polyhydroxyalkanoate depolymerase n=1 Tax=Microvirga massiliensis TaxID=1033741 RepID=UPI00062B4B73|nr:PHB depolymerase family esterase [Microvirga massiliensis]